VSVRNYIHTFLERERVLTDDRKEVTACNVKSGIFWEIVTEFFHVLRGKIIMGVEKEKIDWSRYSIAKV
jgi:hypothetical protein